MSLLDEFGDCRPTCQMSRATERPERQRGVGSIWVLGISSRISTTVFCDWERTSARHAALRRSTDLDRLHAALACD